ncbi:uncharacterized protein A4U43_C03F30520 [Asparagus officinalis]|uniref:Uncharacterized protein n=1 Tax=Asparagus officinalis TaxID=4686 RepID=A0A5P1FE67_ASPOF|nr:uncharacterized protein A4U43_C03F30520 [Asparagus officinalis]
MAAMRRKPTPATEKLKRPAIWRERSDSGDQNGHRGGKGKGKAARVGMGSQGKENEGANGGKIEKDSETGMAKRPPQVEPTAKAVAGTKNRARRPAKAPRQASGAGGALHPA